MARYHNEFSFQADPSMLFQQIHQYLLVEGYEYRDFKGEQVYKKGMGLATGPSFIKVMAGNGRVIVEAWIKFAALPGVYAGELGIDGVVGAIPKAFIRTRVQYIESLIMQAGGINLGMVINMPPEQAAYIPDQNAQPYPSMQSAPQQPVQQSVQPQPVQPQPAQAAPAFCDQCGNRLVPTDVFCNQCGKKIR